MLQSRMLLRATRGMCTRGGRLDVLRRAGELATRLELPQIESPERSRVLRCCLIGPTNAGKSTLLNLLLDTSVSAVSPKIHTTRENTLGYLTDSETATQVEFIDAPGSLGPDVPALHRAVWDALMASELALVVVDSSDRVSEQQVIRFLDRLGRELQELGERDPALRPKTALVLNKVDRVKHKERLLKTSSRLHSAFSFDWPPFMISAKTGGGVGHLRDWLLLASKPGEWVAPEGVVHTQTPLARATEIIREQLFGFFRQEVPYMLEQRNIGWTELERPPGALRIDQQILVPRSKRSTIKLVNGRLPGIADAARKRLREEFGRTVFLQLSVATVSDTSREIAFGELAEDGDIGGFSKRLVERGRR